MDCFPELQILICEFSQIHLNPKKGNLRNGISFFIARSAFGYMHDTRIPHPRIVSQPPPLRGTSFQRKEGECRFPYSKAFSPYCHFERKREIFFVCGQERLRGKRGTGNMLHATWGVRCFMQTALRRKTETGNEKDPSTTLGMTKRGGTSHIVFRPQR